MKKVILALLTVIILLSLSSCKTKDFEYDYNIKDALKISAWVFDESRGEEYFVYDAVSKDYDYNYDESLYVYEQLKMNEVKILPPNTFYGAIRDLVNLNMFFEFNGIIEVISPNKDVQLSCSNSLNPFTTDTTGTDRRFYGFEVKLPKEGFIAINPLGSNRGQTATFTYKEVEQLPHKVGREYYLTINTYKLADETLPVITACLKIVELDDKRDSFDETTACFSVELVSYEYSDIYKMMYEIVDEDE